MNANIRKNANKGFSLVELIVVIAIMAVLVAVLAPALLQYVERSRAQKDDSAMGEVTNAVMLALSDQDIYDEVLSHSVAGNFSCYIDPTTENETAPTIAADAARGSAKVILTSKGNQTDEQYIYDDNARLDDETSYYASGVMRGMTITFHPDGEAANGSCYKIGEAKVNEFAADTTGTNLDGGARASLKVYSGDAVAETLLKDLKAKGNPNTYLYNRVRATVGDEISLTSQTYRNSNYTVFIRMGSTGGNQADAQDAIAVYGQWSGTNLFTPDEAPVAIS